MKKIGIIQKVFGLWLLFLSHLTLSYAVSGSWTTPGTPIGLSSGAAEYVSVSFNPTNSQYVATWANSSTGTPFYSFFNGTSWTTPAAISPGFAALTNVFNAVNPITGHIQAAWIDKLHSNHNFTSSYNPMSMTWSMPTALDATASAGNVFLSVNSTTGQFLATWTDTSMMPTTPFYAFSTGGSWTIGGAIDSLSHHSGSVFTSFDPLSAQFLATWVDFTTHTAFFSVYNGSWTIASAIPLGSSSGAINNVFNSVNTNTGDFLATWVDTATHTPYYSIYNGTSWTIGLPIPQDGSNGAVETVATSFDPVAGVFLATWGDSTSTSTAYYALFDGTSWTTASTIPGAVSAFALFSAANSGGGEFLSTWRNTDSFPYYAIFTSILVEPPATLTANANIANQFGVVKEYYNLLKWTPSPTQGVVEYRIFRNSELIATVGANIFHYKDHNRKKHEFTVYSIVSVDANGNQSSPITVDVE